MDSILEILTRERSTVTEEELRRIDPDETINEDDTFVGEVPPEIRPMRALAVRYAKEGLQAFREGTPEEALRLKDISNLAAEIFWQDVKTHFKRWGKGEHILALRQKWNVVVPTEELSPSGVMIIDLLRLP